MTTTLQAIGSEASWCGGSDESDGPPSLASDSQPEPEPEPEVPDSDALRALARRALELTNAAVTRVEEDRVAALAATGARMRAEQDILFKQVMCSLPAAVCDAASAGRRTAHLRHFAGGDLLAEFSVLYMLKGPHNKDDRAEMRAMGVKPLMGRLRNMLTSAGFGLHLSWQRATNQNLLSVTW